ncbi:MAG: caspase family protein [Gammaproteobacteria bacterium]|nr:caspase family protein [Gammaproteobacteria bacterium]
MLRTTCSTLLALILLLGCAPGGNHIINVDTGDDTEADKLLIVDCLLPGQIKKLGTGTTYVTPRRPAKVTALDCQERGGEYVSYAQANAGSALKVWLTAAQEGDPVAQTYVGEIYEKGLGLQPNYPLALQWYSKASEQGYARAKLNIGYLYERGLGVKQNIITAMNFYRDASGLSDTPMEFAVNLEGDATSGGAELFRALKNDLEAEKQKIQALRGQMEEAESQVEEKRREMESKSKKLDQERKELAKNSSQEKLKQVEEQLEKRRKEVVRLNADIDDYKNELARLQVPAPKIAVAGPTIQLINPSLINLRGASASITVPPDTKTREVIGRVLAPAGIKNFTVNKNVEKLNEQGVFRVLLALNAERTPVQLAAVDSQGKSSVLEFALVWAKGPPLPAVIAPNNDADGDSHNYALVIGNNNYTQFQKLTTPMNDAKTVAEVLSQRYGYKTTTVMNANRYALLAALNRLGQKLTDKDNLLIYYAGHGELDKEKSTGYWMPVDADLKDQRKWIPNSAITDIINALPAKRVLVIADSCYSGALTRTAVPQFDTNLSEADRLSWLRAVSKSRARVALTSGGLQPVADSGGGTHSVFASVFLQVLQENSSVLEGQRLYNEVAARLATNPIALQIGQVPQYAPIRHAGHESGEYFFLPRRAI